jgi:hypothetical protein
MKADFVGWISSACRAVAFGEGGCQRLQLFTPTALAKRVARRGRAAHHSSLPVDLADACGMIRLMSTADLKELLDKRTPEERKWMTAYLLDEMFSVPELQQTALELSELARRRGDLLADRARVAELEIVLEARLDGTFKPLEPDWKTRVRDAAQRRS